MKSKRLTGKQIIKNLFGKNCKNKKNKK